MLPSFKVPNWTVVLALIVPMLLSVAYGDTGSGIYSPFGSSESRDFWSSRCSSVGTSLAFSSVFSVMFYIGLLVVIVALLTGSYQACFKLFTKEMFRYDW